MDNLQLPILVVAGIIAYLSLYAGKLANRIKLPSLIGFMFVGVFLGPSLAGLLSSEIQDSMQFITKIALGFVALSIGMELHIRELRRQGPGIMLVILTESFGAFLVVGLAVFLLTGDPALGSDIRRHCSGFRTGGNRSHYTGVPRPRPSYQSALHSRRF